MYKINLDENMVGLSVQILDTPISGYVVGVIEIRTSLPTEEAHTSEDWNDALSAGGFGVPDMLMQLRYAAYERKVDLNQLPGDLTPMDKAKVEFFEELMSEIAGARQSCIPRAAVRTAAAPG